MVSIGGKGAPAAVARSSSGSVAIRYVLPVLWMTSRLAVMGCIALRGRPDLLVLAVSYVRDRGSLMSMNACYLLYCSSCLFVYVISVFVCSVCLSVQSDICPCDK